MSDDKRKFDGTTGAYPEQRDSFLLNKVVLVICDPGTIVQNLVVSLAEKGADIAVVFTGDISQQAHKNLKRLVVQQGQRCLVLSLKSASKAASKEVADAIVKTLGSLDMFIDYSAASNTSSVWDQKNMNERNLPEYKLFSHYEMMSTTIRHIFENQ